MLISNWLSQFLTGRKGSCSWLFSPWSRVGRVQSIKTWSAKITSRHIKFCKQNTAMLIVLYTWQLTLQDINTTLKELFFSARQYGVTSRENSDEKSADYDLSPNLELSTPTESRHTTCLLGGKSPSVKLMSRKENKGLAKTTQKHGQNHAKITAYRIYKRSTAPKYTKHKHKPERTKTANDSCRT